MMEHWSDIEGYNGLYQVSKLGNIRRVVGGGSIKYMAFHINRSPWQKVGYLRVSLTLDGKQKSYYVSRLVAEAFIPNPENKPQINHIDGNTLNNRSDNLEWCTNQENCKHACDIGLNLGRTGKGRIFKFVHEDGREFVGTCSELSKINKRSESGGYRIVSPKYINTKCTWGGWSVLRDV